MSGADSIIRYTILRLRHDINNDTPLVAGFLFLAEACESFLAWFHFNSLI